jgi:hypothetical protein
MPDSRRGWVIEERRLLEVVDQRLFEEPADWRALFSREVRGTIYHKRSGGSAGHQETVGAKDGILSAQRESSRVDRQAGAGQPIQGGWRLTTRRS